MNEIKVVKVPQYSLLNNALMQMFKKDLNYANGIIDSIIHGPDNSLTEELYLKLLQEVIIRFNTSPKTYEKEDFKQLIQAIISAYKISDSLDLQIYDNLSYEIANKVDAEEGKSLMSDLEHSKLANILSGAEVNVLSDWLSTTGDSFIKNKPTKLSQFVDNLGSNPTHTHCQYITLHQSLEDCVKFTDEASSLKAGIVKLGDDSILLSTPGYTNCLVQKDSNGVLAVKVPNCGYNELTYDEAMSILNL